MKINAFLTLISIVLALLIGYLVYNIAEGKEHDIICGIGASVCLTLTLVPSIGLHYSSDRLGTNIRILSIVSFVLLLISNLIFASCGINVSYYLIVNGILSVVFLALVYKMQNINNI